MEMGFPLFSFIKEILIEIVSNEPEKYAVAIIGGGLAGLTLAIQLADAGISCILFEKNKYPFHKVCGEYISNESRNFIENLGLNLGSLNVSEIKRLQISSPSGKLLKHKFDLGGFGMSRFLLDSKLADIAKQKGVLLLDDCRVNDVKYFNNQFTIDSQKGSFTSEICIGSWGKKSNLDIKLKRVFTEEKKGKNYVGIKYHVQLDFPEDLIELHNFENGYCGISKIENDRYCLCYLTDSDNLKKYNGDIKKMEREILMENPFLKNYLTTATYLFEEPLAISQIRIGYKKAVENDVIMVGDTAGNIAPLSGNGMSMAMRSSQYLSDLLKDYFSQKLSRKDLELKYERFWKKEFKQRVDLSVILQKLLKNKSLSNL
ncbi:MAG: NAD(P)/FAD-dependent oxidoreductase [Bacteroidetes bacterium]|nr:NAD(P)/FAD-dependent oxidoreductase [Bacteroidota bacterium]